ncbi:hypothetical protein O181_020554 [Austropuccinia psidii MF-1]|uniref:SNF2 N-terminal domain-containing protein n=1 Tax=Austropuccinia psidii MF-1 TaxID=1389203 RepID=A0A9Q3C957_9BASI|nr:hypothetical protein [Austropuccinia psidii MF-1]
MFFTWYPNIIFIIESFRTKDFKLEIPREYYGCSHRKCQSFTAISPASNFISSCIVFVIQEKTDKITHWIRPFHDQSPLLPHQKTGLALLWDQEIPNGKSAHNLWATSSPGSTFNARNIVIKKVVSSFESLSANTPLGELLVDDMGLGKTMQAIALTSSFKEWIIANPK